MSAPDFQFEISLSVLNHLGRNLYRNFITVLGEAISNAWDADAKNVWIDIDKENSVFSIKDDGIGMSPDDFQSKFLKIGYSKRKDGATKTNRKRPYIGAKGIGKLALLSCAERVSVFTKTEHNEYTGGVIDNSGLDKAIKEDLIPEQYPLEGLNFDLIKHLSINHKKGTIIFFEETKETIKNSEAYIKKLLALTFKFSLLDTQFNIFVNNAPVTIDDLKELMSTTEFLWLINGYEDDFIKGLSNLKADARPLTTNIDLNGFIATVKKPRYLKIANTDERATIDLFVNGRLREKNIIRHIPTQRIVENYVYGQIHFNLMDQTGSDPFTSSREGIVENDENFKVLLTLLQKKIIPIILDEWDELRLARGDEGDDENARKTKKQRRAIGLYKAASEEYAPDEDAPEKQKVNDWLNELQPDAEFNLTSYADCFLAENLVRKYIRDQAIPIKETVQRDANKYKNQEHTGKEKANICFDISRNNDDLSYLGMDQLALTAEGSKEGQASLWQHSVSYKPVRNAVCHTNLLTNVAKNHLNVTYHNVQGRVSKLISGK